MIKSFLSLTDTSVSIVNSILLSSNIVQDQQFLEIIFNKEKKVIFHYWLTYYVTVEETNNLDLDPWPKMKTIQYSAPLLSFTIWQICCVV